MAALPTAATFADKVILITGASDGIGGELARPPAPEKRRWRAPR